MATVTKTQDKVELPPAPLADERIYADNSNVADLKATCDEAVERVGLKIYSAVTQYTDHLHGHTLLLADSYATGKPTSPGTVCFTARSRQPRR